MQCNGSDGLRLPGLWDNIGSTPVRLPLAPAARNCPESGWKRIAKKKKINKNKTIDLFSGLDLFSLNF